MANEFEKLSESGFVIVSGCTAGQFKIDFGEVHADGLWNESLEEFESEIEADTISFSGSSALESATVNSIDIERDPVFALSLMVEILMNGLMHNI
jgi:hypothetical protein